MTQGFEAIVAHDTTVTSHTSADPRGNVGSGLVFGRRKESVEPTVENFEVEETTAVPGVPQKKGRPTPKRRDQEAARRQPLVPADRDAAKKQAKQEARAQRLKSREAFARGDENALPKRDRGPIKRFIRDTVDSRWNIGEILLPLMLIVLVMTVVPNRSFQMGALVLVWVVIAVGVIDCVLLWRRLKKQIRARFNEDPPKGSRSYAIMRAFQMRLSRMPKPQVKRGEAPR
ncbi:DUF3043 domain-containing protein [Yimella sp. cx-51]|nr:DUF3043 domain-containing protein [Yimella sp. cx-51]MBC9957581.1 DUF3043 domain-containing protein [Yimella sp. cx-51]QTH37055.1 DUF3043 domain-containing protein [Yimella sp. cx-51]